MAEWCKVTGRVAASGTPHLLHGDGTKIFRSKVAKSVCVLFPDGTCKTGFSDEKAAKVFHDDHAYRYIK